MSIPLHFAIYNNETPFKLTYGTDAMILVEVGEPSARKAQFEEALNDEGSPTSTRIIASVP